MVDLRVSSGHLLRYAGGGGGSGEPKKIMGLAIAGLRIALAGGVDERGACQWWYAGMSLRYVGRSAVVEGKGSISRKVGKADVSDISVCERAWVVLLAGAMAIVYRCAVSELDEGCDALCSGACSDAEGAVVL